MYRRSAILTATIPDGTAVSNAVGVENFPWLLLEVPSGNEAAAVTLQVLSGDGSTWIDAVTLSDTTNRIKGLSSSELAVFGPMAQCRLKLGSNVSGDKTYYLHVTT